MRVEEKAALAAWREGKGPFWVDLESDDPEDMVEWLKKFGLDPDLLASIKAPDSTGRVLPLKNLVFFEYPALDDLGTPIQFAGLCFDRLLVTMHHQCHHPDREDALTSKLRLREGTCSGLVCALAISHSTLLRRATLALRDQTLKLSGTMDETPESVSREDILVLKRRLLDLDRMTDEEMAVFELLQTTDKPPLDLLHLAGFSIWR